MRFLITDTFTDSLGRLTGEEQKAAKTTAFDLQINPAQPGLQMHRLDRARDPNFLSVRVSKDIRLIVHRTDDSLLLCYVDHHDRAYAWAESRRLQVHPKTGAAQLVEIRETIQEVLIPRYAVAEDLRGLGDPVGLAKQPLFAVVSDDELLSYGVPPEWLEDVRQADEDSLLALAGRLPAEAAEALLELATGGKPRVTQPIGPIVSPFDHPDAQRRFRVVADVEELRHALEYPWDRWMVFLHPEQRQIVERSYGGPARVSGSAGTGKTIVALHRAVFLARANPDARVLLTTFSEMLANALRARLRRLINNEPQLAERLEVHSIDSIGARLYRSHFGPANLAPREVVAQLLKQASGEVGNHRFRASFLLTEWEQVVDAWQLQTWESYRDVVRLGRKTRLPEPQRAVLWSIFERARAGLAALEMITPSSMFTRLASVYNQDQTPEVLETSGVSRTSGVWSRATHPPFDYIVVDESQDIGVSHLRLFAALGGDRPDALFFAGDLGQRIFQQPFSWLALGVDIRGRSRTLRVNYRTSHQIRAQADRLLGPEVRDADGNVEERGHTVSAFNGPPPEITVLDSQEEEIARVAGWISERVKDGVAPHELAIFVRSAAQLERARAAVKRAGVPFKILDDSVETVSGYACVSTMHLAKGLEFRAVAVMACDDEVIPMQERIEAIGDEADLQDVYDTERHLLYVACTRARDHLLVTGVSPSSEFLDDLRV